MGRRVPCRAYPLRQNHPIGIFLRSELPPAGMKCVPSRFGSQRMQEKPARLGLARYHHLRGALEILAGLLLSPVAEAGRESREMKDSVRGGMAAVTAGVSWPLL